MVNDKNPQIVVKKMIKSSTLLQRQQSPVVTSSLLVTSTPNKMTSSNLLKSPLVEAIRSTDDESHCDVTKDDDGYEADVSLNVSRLQQSSPPCHSKEEKTSSVSKKLYLPLDKAREGSLEDVETPTSLKLPDEVSITSKSSSLDTCLTEDYFSYNELGQIGLNSPLDYQRAIEECKEKIMQLPHDSSRREILVKNLVDLRLKLENLKDEPSNNEGWEIILKHHFRRVTNRTMKYYCDCCSTLIWGILQIRYKCKECGFNVHAKCLLSVRRTCVAVTAKKITQPQLSISPEVGLANQQYCCAECKNSISITGEGLNEARLCDYTGLYYCPNCHWNDLHPSPARILHNWDHTPRKVCRHSFQLLKKLQRKPILNIEQVNPMLFNFVEDLSNIQKMRDDILRMKPYLTTCQKSAELKLLQKLGKRQHFVDNADMYTMQDLKEVENGVLLQELQKIHHQYKRHIKFDCSICQAKGFVCEVCKSGKTLFPFDPMISSCPKCHAVFHGDCFSCIDTLCPRCKRFQSRRRRIQNNSTSSSSTSSDDEHDVTINGFMTSSRPLTTLESDVKTSGKPPNKNPFLDDGDDFEVTSSNFSPRHPFEGDGNVTSSKNPLDDRVSGSNFRQGPRPRVQNGYDDKLNPFSTEDDVIKEKSGNPFLDDVINDDDYNDELNPFVE